MGVDLVFLAIKISPNICTGCLCGPDYKSRERTSGFVLTSAYHRKICDDVVQFYCFSCLASKINCCWPPFTLIKLARGPPIYVQQCGERHDDLRSRLPFLCHYVFSYLITRSFPPFTAGRSMHAFCSPKPKNMIFAITQESLLRAPAVSPYLSMELVDRHSYSHSRSSATFVSSTRAKLAFVVVFGIGLFRWEEIRTCTLQECHSRESTYMYRRGDYCGRGSS